VLTALAGLAEAEPQVAAVLIQIREEQFAFGA
jgi:hypothetical protein